MTAQPKVLVASSTWWPLSARMAMAMLRNGCRVSAICPAGSPIRFVGSIERIYTYGGLRSLKHLKNAIEKEDPAIVIPCDDGVRMQMQHLHATEPGLKAVIERSLGDPKGFSVVRDRGALLELAAELGIRIPVTKRVETEADVVYSGMAARGVLKRSGTWGGNGVEIAMSETEALASFRRLHAPVTAAFAWKRFLINREPLSIWMWGAKEPAGVTIQQFVTGRPANAMLCCWQGQVLAMVAVEVLRSQGATGAATVVRVIEHREISEAARRIAARLGLTGFYGLDFMLEMGTGAPYLIELNPRCTQLGHQNLVAEGSLAAVLAAKLTGVSVARVGTPVRGEIVLFPQAVKLNPENPYLHHGFHDVPWEEPALVKNLLEDGWAERRWLARLYHFLRPPTEVREVAFEAEPAAWGVMGGSAQR